MHTHKRDILPEHPAFWVPLSGVAQLESPGRNRPDQGPTSKTGTFILLACMVDSAWSFFLRGLLGVPVVWRGRENGFHFYLSRRCGNEEMHTNQWPPLLRHWWRTHPLLISCGSWASLAICHFYNAIIHFASGHLAFTLRRSQALWRSRYFAFLDILRFKMGETIQRPYLQLLNCFWHWGRWGLASLPE